MDIRETLGRVELFEGLSPASLNELVHRGTTFTYAPDRTIVEQGGLDAGFQLLLAGDAVVSVNGTEVARLGAGDHFGEISLVDGAPRSSTVVAGPEGAETFAVSSIAFSDMMDEHPEIARTLLTTLAAHIRRIEARHI